MNNQCISNKNWSRNGYTLLGWSENRSATDRQYSPNCGVDWNWIIQKSPNVNLYAVWKASGQEMSESEAAGKTISVSEYAYYDPYFYPSNCQDSKCIDRTCTVSYNINDKLGLLYNWAAAVGASEREIYADSDEFSYPRQGICPNGWHVPTLFDYVNLVFNMNPDGGEDAKLLKSKEGWCNTGKYDQGLDTYGFTLYPAGEVTRDGHYETVSNVGNLGTLWVVDGAHGELATYCIAYTYDPSMYYNEDGRKYEAHSVRCVKN